MAYVPNISNYKPFYIQRDGDESAIDTRKWGLVAKSNPYPVLPSPKKPHSVDWVGRDGDDEYTRKMSYEAMEFSVSFYVKAYPRDGKTAAGELYDCIRGFFRVIRDGDFRTFDAYTGVGFPAVRYAGYKEQMFRANDDYATAIIDVSFRTNAPNSRVILRNGSLEEVKQITIIATDVSFIEDSSSAAFSDGERKEIYVSSSAEDATIRIRFPEATGAMNLTAFLNGVRDCYPFLKPDDKYLDIQLSSLSDGDVVEILTANWAGIAYTDGTVSRGGLIKGKTVQGVAISRDTGFIPLLISLSPYEYEGVLSNVPMEGELPLWFYKETEEKMWAAGYGDEHTKVMVETFGDDAVAAKWAQGRMNDGYLPSYAEMDTIYRMKEQVNELMQSIGGTPIIESIYGTCIMKSEINLWAVRDNTWPEPGGYLYNFPCRYRSVARILYDR